MDREEMAAWQYREENPGYSKEITYVPSEGEDPEFTAYMQAEVDAENERIRGRNANTALAEANAKIAELTALLIEHGITIPEED